MTAVEAWASKAGQIGDGSSPPNAVIQLRIFERLFLPHCRQSR
jgi:hypothetical protein